MLAFWEDIQCRTREDGRPGPSQTYPGPGKTSYTWPALFQAHPGGVAGWGAAPEPQTVVPLKLDAVWAPVAKDGCSVKGATYDACFQGF